MSGLRASALEGRVLAPGWRIASVAETGDVLQLALDGPDGPVPFTIAPRSDDRPTGPFDTPLWSVAYGATSLRFEAFSAQGRALAALVASLAPSGRIDFGEPAPTAPVPSPSPSRLEPADWSRPTFAPSAHVATLTLLVGDASELAAAASVAARWGQPNRTVQLVHRVTDAGVAAALASSARRHLWGSGLTLVLEHDDAGPTLGELTRTLPVPLGPGPEARFQIALDTRAGTPACLFPEALPAAMRDERRSVRGGAYGESCAGCALRAGCGGVSEGYLRRHGAGELRPFTLPAGESTPSWRTRARWLLEGRPEASVRLADLLPSEERRRRDCVLPWTRLELAEDASAGPCCSDYQSRRVLVTPEQPVDEVWQSPQLRGFRTALAGPGHPSTCKTSCPVLAARSDSLESIVLRGGAEAGVAHQLAVVDGILAGTPAPAGGPLVLVVSTTSYCNYDCLMCDCGERGTLADERPEAFWEALRPRLPTLHQLAVNGGEPLASPIFRRFLESLDTAALPNLHVALTTNASYLTPRQVEKLSPTPLADVTVSLNAATAECYLDVNRGLPFERIREHLDALLVWRRGRPSRRLAYSMVLLKRNVEEIRAFAELAGRDGAEVRYLLPNRNRNGQSILLDPAAMRTAADALESVAAGLRGTPDVAQAAAIEGSARVLRERLRRGVLAVL